MTSIKLKIVLWFMESFTIQGMITVSSVLIFLTQISESDLTNYDRLKQTLNEENFVQKIMESTRIMQTIDAWINIQKVKWVKH